MAHDDAGAPRHTPADGTQPLAPGDLSDRTAGLPQSVTTTTPMSDLPPQPQQQPQPQQPPQQPAYPPPSYRQHPQDAPPGGPYDPRDDGPRDDTREQPARRGGPSRRRNGLVLLACAVVGIGLGVGAARVVGSKDDPSTAAKPTASASSAPVSADVSSFDPVGTGFPRQSGGLWTSQSYTSAKFGNLKPGIGLLLDLGTAGPLRAVTLDAKAGPLTVELRAADSKASAADGYKTVGSAVTAQGPTSLTATSGGSHRYWLVWVTSLAPSSDGKYAAQIGSLTARR